MQPPWELGPCIGCTFKRYRFETALAALVLNGRTFASGLDGGLLRDAGRRTLGDGLPAITGRYWAVRPCIALVLAWLGRELSFLASRESSPGGLWCATFSGLG